MSVLRVTRGKVRGGSWEDYELALRQIIAEAGKVPGLLSRTLAQDLDDPDAGYTISLWESQEAIETYESRPDVQAFRSRLHDHFKGDFSSSLCRIKYWDETEFDSLPSI